MKAYTIEAKGDAESLRVQAMLHDYLKEFDFVCDDVEPDLIIGVGGDGTLLHAFHKYKHRLERIAFIGIHTGHLGFYADWLPKEVEKLVLSLAKTEPTIVEYPLLSVEVEHTNGKKERYLALNECTMKSYDGTFVVDLDIKDMLFERFRGDGLCVSTPSGSTAYNKALGGAIIHPSIQAIQIAEMASINNRVFRTIGSPLILPKHHVAVTKPVSSEHFRLTIDHLSQSICEVAAIRFSVAEEKVRFARYRAFPFWRRVRDSFVTDGK
ncbi:MAG: NAD kinase [Bacilli bacterium]